ncbi:MAG: hypothetical protein RLZZ628_1069 [Bacteroidota bacterium]|jgi:hypothetical protein
MIDFLKKQLNKIEIDLENLYKQRRDSGIATVGDYDNKIEHDKAERLKIIGDIEREEERIQKIENQTNKSKTHGIFFAVLVSPIDKVQENIGEQIFKKIPKNRYCSKKNAAEHRPFEGAEPIEHLLLHSGYPFQKIRYLDSVTWDEHFIETITHFQHTVLLVDPLSLCEDNKEIARYFDNSAAGGVIVLSCRSLSKHDKIFSYINTRLKKTFRYLHHSYQDASKICHFYHPLSDDLNLFKRNLREIFDKKFLQFAKSQRPPDELYPNFY